MRYPVLEGAIHLASFRPPHFARTYTSGPLGGEREGRGHPNLLGGLLTNTDPSREQCEHPERQNEYDELTYGSVWREPQWVQSMRGRQKIRLNRNENRRMFGLNLEPVKTARRIARPGDQHVYPIQSGPAI